MPTSRGADIVLRLGPGIDEGTGAALLAEVLSGSEMSKGLVSPLSDTERAQARTGFEGLQSDFRELAGAFFADAERSYQEMSNLKRKFGHVPGLPEAADGIEMRYHRVLRARLNPTFKRYYIDAFDMGMRAAGVSRGQLPNEEKLVTRTRMNEYAYLDNFLLDIHHREGKMPYPQRAVLYGNALEELYWQGYIYGDQSQGRYLRWQLREGETCVDCGFLAGEPGLLRKGGIDPVAAELVEGIPVGGRWRNGVYTAQELARLAIVPQSGALACTTQCHCVVTEAAKPSGAPKGNMARGPYKSLSPKAFTGTGERQFDIAARKRAAGRAKRTRPKFARRRG